jgi:hypothetical protein
MLVASLLLVVRLEQLGLLHPHHAYNEEPQARRYSGNRFGMTAAQRSVRPSKFGRCIMQALATGSSIRSRIDVAGLTGRGEEAIVKETSNHPMNTGRKYATPHPCDRRYAK